MPCTVTVAWLLIVDHKINLEGSTPYYVHVMSIATRILQPVYSTLQNGKIQRADLVFYLAAWAVLYRVQ